MKCQFSSKKSKGNGLSLPCNPAIKMHFTTYESQNLSIILQVCQSSIPGKNSSYYDSYPPIILTFPFSSLCHLYTLHATVAMNFKELRSH